MAKHCQCVFRCRRRTRSTTTLKKGARGISAPVPQSTHRCRYFGESLCPLFLYIDPSAVYIATTTNQVSHTHWQHRVGPLGLAFKNLSKSATRGLTRRHSSTLLVELRTSDFKTPRGPIARIECSRACISPPFNNTHAINHYNWCGPLELGICSSFQFRLFKPN